MLDRQDRTSRHQLTPAERSDVRAMLDAAGLQLEAWQWDVLDHALAGGRLHLHAGSRTVGRAAFDDLVRAAALVAGWDVLVPAQRRGHVRVRP